jgi:pSer/pThr/pTyr-binding forkhead associated (FHA) protein
MFSGPSPSPNSAPSPPTSPSRFGRGLTYLRNYTQHLHPRSDPDHSPPIADPSNLLAPGNSPPQRPSTAQTPRPVNTASSPPPSTTASAVPATSVSGAWLPSQHGPLSALIAAASGRSHIVLQPASDQPASETMTRNTTTTATIDTPPPSIMTAQPPPQSSSPNQQLPSIRFIPHHDPRSHRPSLSFTAVSRTLPTPETVIRVGRYSERDTIPESRGNVPSAAPVGFKSKVVSRRHCEFWCENSQWFVRDVKSSSGTFLNHLRLSPPGVESKPWPVNDGDVIQLGIDFRGGEEMIFRCVKIRIECNRGWQKGLNPFK